MGTGLGSPTAGPLHASPTGTTSRRLLGGRGWLQQDGASSPRCKRRLLAEKHGMEVAVFAARGWVRIYVSTLSEPGWLSPRLRAPKWAALVELSGSTSVSTFKPVKCRVCKSCQERAEVPAVLLPQPLPGHRAQQTSPSPAGAQRPILAAGTVLQAR